MPLHREVETENWLLGSLGFLPFLFVSVYICVSLGVSPWVVHLQAPLGVSHLSAADQAAGWFSTAGKFQGRSCLSCGETIFPWEETSSPSQE